MQTVRRRLTQSKQLFAIRFCENGRWRAAAVVFVDTTGGHPPHAIAIGAAVSQ
jgi:hypothetical protein